MFCMTMNRSMQPIAILFFLVFLTIAPIHFSFCYGNHDVVMCLESEKQALSTFKQGLEDPSNRLSSWEVEDDCCKWAGVVCNNLTGHVLELHLGMSKLRGKINPSLLNLTSLEYLDLSENELEGSLPRFLGNLCNLSIVYLSLNNFSGELFISSSKCAVHALETLIMMHTKLSILSLDQLEKFKNLRHIDLPGNLLSGSIPVTIGRLESLEYLDLGFNLLSGSIPVTIGRLACLKELYLGSNQLNGTLPQSLGQLLNLQHLDVTDNLLEGNVSEVHFTNLINLRKLFAVGNRLTLKVRPDWIPRFQLEAVSLGSWHLGPKFPIWLQSQKDLGFLELSNTGILDVIPIWLWNLTSSLYFLDLSHNQIHGEIPYLLAPPEPQIIYLNSNHFKGPLPLISSNLNDLDLSNNSFSGGLSRFLCDREDKQKILAFLNLQGNLLSGEIPDCWMSWQFLTVIEMGNNNLTGKIPRSLGLLGGLRSLHLRNNQLSGEISLSLQDCPNLLLVDLSENEFQGSIPTWMAERTPNLTVLALRSNKLDGAIPPEFCHFSFLQVLDLANNNLSGAIPWCINNFTAMVEKPKYKFHSYPDHTFAHPAGYGYFSENALLVVKGSTYQYDKTLTLVASIDLSNNNISGKIPEELTSLQGLFSLNLSGNHLTGVIPKKMGNMGSLESLDLSNNQLYGEIPPSMSGLNFLTYLNLSNNNLSGKIPSSTQLQSFNASSFIGNKLCGPPLTKNCSIHDTTPNVGNEGESKSARSEVDWFYVLMALGFAVGFWGVSAPILFIKSWRYAYFQFLDDVWTRLVLLYMSKCV